MPVLQNNQSRPPASVHDAEELTEATKKVDVDSLMGDWAFENGRNVIAGCFGVVGEVADVGMFVGVLNGVFPYLDLQLFWQVDEADESLERHAECLWWGEVMLK